MKHPSDDFAREVDGPFYYTFTAPLPFPLGIPSELGHTIGLDAPYADPKDSDIFGPKLTIDIRVFTFEEPGLPMWPPCMQRALKHFYNHDFVDDDPSTRYGEDSLSAHHQWITLETPCAPTAEELEHDDPAFAFHRCLYTFNLFLRAVQAATRDIRIRPITSHDLQPIVIIGAIRPEKGWEFLNLMLMHPEARPDPLPPPGGPIAQEQLDAGLSAVLTQKPYLTTMLWRSRAQRAMRQTGDPADAIISFQVAAESLLFDTFRMLLIDEGLSLAEIQSELEKERPFKSFITRIMPSKLGGRWDATAGETAIGEYWEKLYKVRNAVVHTGFEPHGGEAEAAQNAYWRLRDHVEERLRANKVAYPRTTLARLGEKGLKECGILSRRMRRFLDTVESEPGPWYWPYDAAGRDRAE